MLLIVLSMHRALIYRGTILLLGSLQKPHNIDRTSCGLDPTLYGT
jgi:hypothetical protein